MAHMRALHSRDSVSLVMVDPFFRGKLHNSKKMDSRLL
jgi:hypothetical protein